MGVQIYVLDRRPVTLLVDGAAGNKRPGNVSRNTWVVEAITEKLAKEQQNAAESDRPHV
jgi:hypothetical protein